MKFIDVMYILVNCWISCMDFIGLFGSFNFGEFVIFIFLFVYEMSLGRDR